MHEGRKKGVAILLVSEDLEEIFSLSDRIAVMYEGRIMGIVPAAEVGYEEIGLMMTGVERCQEGASPKISKSFKTQN